MQGLPKRAVLRRVRPCLASWRGGDRCAAGRRGRRAPTRHSHVPAGANTSVYPTFAQRNDGNTPEQCIAMRPRAKEINKRGIVRARRKMQRRNASDAGGRCRTVAWCAESNNDKMEGYYSKTWGFVWSDVLDLRTSPHFKKIYKDASCY